MTQKKSWNDFVIDLIIIKNINLKNIAWKMQKKSLDSRIFEKKITGAHEFYSMFEQFTKYSQIMWE